MEIIKVSSTSVPNHVAGAIASLMREKDKLMIQVIGAAALNQAIKRLLLPEGILFLQEKNLFVFLRFMI